jgi:hypothetical protein
VTLRLWWPGIKTVKVAAMAEEIYEKFSSYDWDKDETFKVLYFLRP